MLDHQPNIYLQSSPHIRSAPPVNVIMRNVVYALLPVCAFSVYQFGISALALILVCTGTCVLTEHLFCKLGKHQTTVGDWSVVITGILLALTLPPSFPLWMGAVGAFVGTAIGKVFFGGLGYNVMNPALIGRAFVQASFTVPITTWTPSMAQGRFTEFIPSTWTPPFLVPRSVTEFVAAHATDGFTGATPLALMKFDHVTTSTLDLFLGTTAGSAGETSALIILLGGIYLVARKMMNWKITFSTLLVAFLTSGAFYLMNADIYPSPWFTLMSGGLMLGAVFMATDMVASPVTPLGIWIYGGMIGLITVIIRLFGGLNEGVMYAILLANAASPIISSLTQPKIYGAVKAKKAKA